MVLDAYQAFASVYDGMMEEIPYQKWCGYVTGLLRAEGIENGILLELGCGTGTLTELFADRGYDMIGVDSSPEMLNEALRKKYESGHDILYLEQDMREFELYGTTAAAVSLCDTMNYLTEPKDFIQVLKLVNNYLDPRGIFIFDLKTDWYYSHVTGDQVFAENGEECSYIWQNSYDKKERMNRYELTLFLQKEDDCYRRFDELHEQRAWSLEEVRTFAEQAGMDFVAAYDNCSDRPAAETSERIYVVLRERGKNPAG